MDSRLLIINYAYDNTNKIFSHQKEIADKIADKCQSTLVISVFGNTKLEKISQQSQIQCLGLKWKEGKTLLNFMHAYLVLFRCIIFFRPQKVFYHMTDSIAALYSPIFKILKIPQALWYAHKANSRYLEFAMKFVDRAISSTEGSFPKINKKVLFIGQGINSELFPRDTERKLHEPINAVHFGRFDPSKKIEMLIRIALHNPNQVNTLTIIGSPSHSQAITYQSKVQSEYHKYVVDGRLSFVDSTDRSEIANSTKSHNLFLHAFEGSLDKTLLEATLLGLPVVTSNREYIKEFGSWEYEFKDLASELDCYLSQTIRSRELECIRRYQKVIDCHSLEIWVCKLFNILENM